MPYFTSFPYTTLFRSRYQISIIIVLFLMLLSIVASAQQIRGDYLETRSADVYTGQCFANGEVNLVGNEAILAWHEQSGSWDGDRKSTRLNSSHRCISYAVFHLLSLHDALPISLSDLYHHRSIFDVAFYCCFRAANSRRLSGDSQRRCLHRPMLRQW